MKKLAIALFCMAFSLPALGQVLASFNDNGLTYGHVHLNVSQSDFERHKQIWVAHLQFKGLFGWPYLFPLGKCFFFTLIDHLFNKIAIVHAPPASIYLH